jgi:aspartate--ammonia ligase
MALADLEVEPGFGIYTDMNAIRPDEELTNIHSLYVDQWDWERVITPEERNLDFLKKTVTKIYSAVVRTENLVHDYYPEITPELPDSITFFHSEDLAEKYPELTPRERETVIAKEYGAVFVIGIGGELPTGEIHDGRAPDYDDWSSLNDDGYFGLNGDIILWNPALNSAFEISSMGIRVNREAMLRQLETKGCQERSKLLFHSLLLNNQLPLSIGGGIGQSRLCMFFLKKMHIGEVQSAIWPDEIMQRHALNEIKLL